MTDTWVSYPNSDHSGAADPSLTLWENEQMLAPLGLTGFLDYAGTDPAFTDNSGRWVTVPSGIAGTIRGTHFETTATTHVPIEANPTSQTRIDVCVWRLRRGLSAPDAGDAYTISPVVIKGVPSASPVTPAYVQNMLTESNGFWDLPFRKVSVVPGSGSITAAQSTHQGWWVSGSGYVGKSTSKPPVEAGVLWREEDTGITYVGTSQGVWLKHYYFVGPVDFDLGSDWERVSFEFTRDGNMVTMSMALQRLGLAVPSNQSVTFSGLGEVLRPVKNQWGTYHCSSPAHGAQVAVTPSGQVILGADFVNVIAQNARVYSNMTWPAKP